MTSKRCVTGLGSQCPPDEKHVRVYFLQHGSTLREAFRFFDHYGAKRWVNSDSYLLKNWKALAWAWIFYQ
jgi:hypothetical protein